MNRLSAIFFSVLWSLLALISGATFAQDHKKIFHQSKAEKNWQYIYPFNDKSYVLAIQYDLSTPESSPIDKNAVLYFGREMGGADTVYWKEQLFIHMVKDIVRYEDYNNDGIKDLTLFITTGSRGSNEHYNLYLIDAKNHKLTKINGFDEITNPSYNKKNKVIVGYGYSGDGESYSVYRINKNRTVSQVGKDFQLDESSDLESAITELVKKQNNKYRKKTTKIKQ